MANQRCVCNVSGEGSPGMERNGTSGRRSCETAPLPPPECVKNVNGRTGTLLSDPESSQINSLLPDLLCVFVLGAECFQDECPPPRLASVLAARRSPGRTRKKQKQFSCCFRTSVLKWRRLSRVRKRTWPVLVEHVRSFPLSSSSTLFGD